MPRAMRVATLLGFFSLGLFVSACATPAKIAEAPVARGAPTRMNAVDRIPRPRIATPTVSALQSRDIAEHDAAASFRALHPKLLACFAKRLARQPNARARVRFDVFVGEDGRAIDVTTIGGSSLGPEVLRCMTDRVRGASFDPPDESGTSRISVPLWFEAAGL